MEIQLPESERRWLRAALILGTFVLALVLLAQLATILTFFSDILLVLLMAWLFAFMISPLVSLILRAAPRLPRVAVVAAIYIALALAVVWVTLGVAGSLATSITSVVAFIQTDPTTLQARLHEILGPLQNALNSLGFRLELVPSTQEILNGIANLGGELA